jgi:fibronectin type 3 domain-containing protein
MQGRMLYDNKFHQELTISVIDYSPGVYIVSFYEDGDGRFKNTKLIIE